METKIGIPFTFLSNLQCPLCKTSLEFSGPIEESVGSGYLLCEGCKRKYPIKNGIPNLVIEENMHEHDRKFSKQADRYGRYYDFLLKVMGLFLLIWEPRSRKNAFKKFEIEKNSNILDISTGTGLNLILLKEKVREKGTIVGLDLSRNMISISLRKVNKKHIKNIQLHRADACFLPYKDNLFDAVITTGGFNTFGQKEKAIAEIIRVAKPGALIIIGDEGLSRRRRNTFLGKLLLKENKLYISSPPKNYIPESFHAKTNWIYRDTFYLVWFYNYKDI